MVLEEHINTLLDSINHDLQAVREHLHQNPELSFEEYKTSAFIQKELTKLGIPFSSIGNTGIVAFLKGNSTEGPCVAIRAELDALPIQEENPVSYASKNTGIMHACGHDVHMTCVLGAAKILKELSSYWSGSVKLIFQPGEEKLPGGASLLIQEGVLQNPKVDYMLAQHVAPELAVGTFGYKKGTYMASCDEIYIDVHGKGGHGALPHLTIDPVLVSAHILIGLQSLISRSAKPTTPSVLSFGNVQANGATNVIPSTVRLEGTFRTFDESWRWIAHEKIVETAQNIALAYGASAEVKISKGYPCLVNDLDLSDVCAQSMQSIGTEVHIVPLELRMTSDDFAYYTQHIPSFFARLGVRSSIDADIKNIHTPHFDVDLTSIKYGVKNLVYLVLGIFKNTP